MALPEAENAESRVIVEEEGFLVDRDTGEVLGLVERKDEFHVTNLDEADWVLDKVQQAEVAALAVNARRDFILAMLAKQERRFLQKSEWLRARFGSEIERVAQATLDATKGKAKTVTLDHGEISFRTTPGTKSINDMKAAVEWAEKHSPDLVKRADPYVNLSDVAKVRPDVVAACSWVTVLPGGEKMTIKVIDKKGV
jgi:phage host-nuclease inhibitor protein Gam